MGIQQETKKDALNEGGLCCGFSLRALGLVRSPDHSELVGLCHSVASGFQCLLSPSQVHLEGPPGEMMTVLVDIILVFLRICLI